MTRLATFLLLLLAVGCQRDSHKAGDLTPYLQLTQGTHVVVHVIATNPAASTTVDMKAEGTLFSITPEMVRIRARPEQESVGYPRELVRKIEVTK